MRGFSHAQTDMATIYRMEAGRRGAEPFPHVFFQVLGRFAPIGQSDADLCAINEIAFLDSIRRFEPARGLVVNSGHSESVLRRRRGQHPVGGLLVRVAVHKIFTIYPAVMIRA